MNENVRKLVRWLTLVMLLCSASAWSQERVLDCDGRNWINYSRVEQGAIVFGMMIIENTYLDLIRMSEEIGEVSSEFLRAVEGLCSSEWTVEEIRDVMNTYYSIPAKRVVPIWKAYYLSRGIPIWTGDAP